MTDLSHDVAVLNALECIHYALRELEDINRAIRALGDTLEDQR